MQQNNGHACRCNYIIMNFLSCIYSCPEIVLRDTQACWILIDGVELFQPSIIDLT